MFGKFLLYNLENSYPAKTAGQTRYIVYKARGKNSVTTIADVCAVPKEKGRSIGNGILDGID